MISFEGLSENFRFIVLEVLGQVRATQCFMREPTREIFTHITEREDYIDNLKTIIEDKCFSRLHTTPSLDKREVNRIRAIHSIAVNLERIADHCINILGQMAYLSDTAWLNSASYDPMFEEILTALERIMPAMEHEDLPAALAICRAEYEIDSQYKTIFERSLPQIPNEGTELHDYVTSIFIYRYLERIGDGLLNIGEALIFAVLGEKIKIKQFDALQRTLTDSGFSTDIGSIDYRSIWGTRSGCRIGHVRQPDGAQIDGQGTIYKEGARRKIEAEKRNTERWASLFPNLVPTIYGYHEHGGQASLLVEFLQGCTFDEIILTADEETLKNAMFVLLQTLHIVWERTRIEQSTSTDYIRQIRSRQEAVQQFHPELHRDNWSVCGHRVLSSDALLDACAIIEKKIPAPFTVFTHGDFNLSNLVYDHVSQSVRFIDLHRSRDYDFVQDISVFVLSAYRMPVFDPASRERITWAIQEALTFAMEYAAEHHDETFQARMALALARSFYTSTRFELQLPFAREMFLRSHYLLEKLLAHKGDWADFTLPQYVIR